MIHSLAGATIVTPDLDAAIAAYRDHLGYTGAPPTLVGEALARGWGVPQAAGARMAVLRPASGEARFIRLVEGAPAPGFRPLACLGWTAIEIVVQDLQALADRLADSPFRIIGPPAVLDFDFTDAISAMQVVGPGGEILYLTQIDGVIPGFDLPAALSIVGQMFIMVLATAGIADSASFYEEQGAQVGPTIAARIAILSEAYDLPAEQRHDLATVALAERSLIEIDAFPAAVVARPASAIGLPSGIAMVSMATPADDPAGSGSVIIGRAGEWIELLGD
jgi:hypothetical protein